MKIASHKVMRSFTAFRILLSFTILSSFAISVFAQAEQKVEIGGQFSIARLRDLYSSTPYDSYVTNLGFGGRVSFNFNRNIAVEGQLDYFPQSYERSLQTPMLSVFGVKAGRRGKKLGAFLKARPGFLRWKEPVVCGFSGSPCRIPFFQRTNFAFDIGGGTEFYPSKRTLIRVDFSDVMTRIKKITGHNFQTSIGVGWRF